MNYGWAAICVTYVAYMFKTHPLWASTRASWAQWWHSWTVLGTFKKAIQGYNKHTPYGPTRMLGMFLLVFGTLLAPAGFLFHPVAGGFTLVFGVAIVFVVVHTLAREAPKPKAPRFDLNPPFWAVFVRQDGSETEPGPELVAGVIGNAVHTVFDRFECKWDIETGEAIGLPTHPGLKLSSQTLQAVQEAIGYVRNFRWFHGHTRYVMFDTTIYVAHPDGLHLAHSDGPKEKEITKDEFDAKWNAAADRPLPEDMRF